MSAPPDPPVVPALEKWRELVAGFRQQANQARLAAEIHRRNGQEQSKQFHSGMETAFLEVANRLENTQARILTGDPPCDPEAPQDAAE